MFKIAPRTTRVALVTALAALAAPGVASAHQNTITATTACVANSTTATVTWNVTNSQPSTAETITASSRASAIAVGTGLAGGATYTRAETVAQNTTVGLQVSAQWTNGVTQTTEPYSITTPGDCRGTAPTPVNPTLTPPTCDSAGVVNVPADTSAIDYALVANSDGSKTVTATPKAGYKWSDGTAATRTLAIYSAAALAQEQCVTPPTPPAPPAPPVTPAPQAAVKAATVVSGTAALRGPSGCPTSRVVRASVNGRQVAKVTFFVDGRKAKTLTHANKGSAWILPIELRKLAKGRHTVTAKVQFKTASQTKAKTLRYSFSRCASSVTPTFTG
jgi:hypothetical protein